MEISTIAPSFDQMNIEERVKENNKKSALTAQEKAEIDAMVRDYNRTVSPDKEPQKNLGKDDFLKILITQLSYQDPTAPMEDKEFIAQMAQFSTLDQMTSMANDFSKLTALLGGSEATSSLGKSVEIAGAEDTLVRGTVKAVARGDTPKVQVNGTYYPWSQVTQVFEE